MFNDRSLMGAFFPFRNNVTLTAKEAQAAMKRAHDTNTGYKPPLSCALRQVTVVGCGGWLWTTGFPKNRHHRQLAGLSVEPQRRLTVGEAFGHFILVPTPIFPGGLKRPTQ